MDFKTESVLVRRDTRTGTFTPDALTALAVTASMNAADPDNKVAFDHHAVRNDDGSVTVTLTSEAVVPEAAPASSPAAPTLPPIPGGLASTIGALSGAPAAG